MLCDPHPPTVSWWRPLAARLWAPSLSVIEVKVPFYAGPCGSKLAIQGRGEGVGVPVSAERETEPQREDVACPESQQGGVTGARTQICLNLKAHPFPMPPQVIHQAPP